MAEPIPRQWIEKYVRELLNKAGTQPDMVGEHMAMQARGIQAMLRTWDKRLQKPKQE